MWLTIVAIAVGAAALAVLLVLLTGSPNPGRAAKRLASLDAQFAPVAGEAAVDIRRAQHKLSDVPWLNTWLTKMNLAASSTRYFYQAGVTMSLGALVIGSFSLAAGGSLLLYLQLDAVLPALMLSLLLLPLPLLYVRHRRTVRLGALEQQLPDALGMMVSALRVGHSLTASIGAVAQEFADPMGAEMRKCFDEQNFGVDLRTALMNLLDRAPIQDLRIFVAAVLIQKESGGNLAEVLEKVAATTRERFRLKKQVSVHTAQGRMTGWILSLLPLLLGLGMYLMNPDGMSVLWTREVGLKMLYTAGVMDVIGTLIIRKIVAIQV